MIWPTFRNRFASLILLVGVLLAGGCATPISVEHLDHATVHQELTRNVLSARTLSNPTKNVLRQRFLTDRFRERPEYAIADLHAVVAEGHGDADDFFALAEMSFLHAEERGGRPYYLASALYAYAFLFPGDAGQPPDPYDPRLRLASDLYNRGLTSGLSTDNGDGIAIRSASYPLPFGRLDVDFDPRDLEWGGRQLTSFFPVAELEVHGLDNRYRQSGIGAPLAAGTTQANVTKGFQVGARVKVPVTALLRVDDPQRQLAGGSVRAQLELHASSDTQAVVIDRQQVPLEIEYTSTLAYFLSGSKIWDWELAGFLRGSLLAENPTRLGAMEPYKPGRFPVVFVHGTASSPARWAEMLNDLRSDPRIRDHFQFWFFGYETGNPVPYSALLLRESLQEAISALDPSGSDPALREMVVIGHSQGGLLTKLTAVDSGDRFWSAAFRKPPEELSVSPESRDLLKRSLFVKPVPSVKRLVFIATPHGGSYVAGNRISHYIASLVRLPGNILKATTEVLAQRDGETATLTGQAGFGSVYGMTPGSVLVQTLARIPLADGVKAHSIIPVRGDGPIDIGDDGVVQYKSAHIEGVESEYIVRSGHSTQADPHTIEEVRRILLLHWAESCTKRGNCGLEPAGIPLMAGKSR
jgi:pimeloyl-ACP methyl ester carboxylesterase